MVIYTRPAIEVFSLSRDEIRQTNPSFKRYNSLGGKLAHPHAILLNNMCADGIQGSSVVNPKKQFDYYLYVD